VIIISIIKIKLGNKMLEQIYLANLTEASQQVVQRRQIQDSEKGMMHSKQAFRYEVVKSLPQEADSFDEIFKYAKPFATFKTAWIDTDLSDCKTTATSLGGSFGFDSASYHNTKLHVAAYTSQKVPFLNPTDTSLNYSYFDENGDSFTYIAEASIDYEDDNFLARIGRIRIDTPYADSDDIRMAANTFEGFLGEYSIDKNFKMQTYFLSRWAGYDSGENQQLFKPLYEDSRGEKSFGAFGASVAYSFNNDDEASLWLYHVDKMSDIVYTEVAGHFDMSDALHIEYGVQAATINEIDNSNIAGDILGAMAIFDFEDFFIGFAGNYAFVKDDNSITNGFGGGPYYTSLDESTIGFVSEQAVGSDIVSARLGAGFKLGFIGMSHTTFELVHGNLKSTDNLESYDENDIVLTYSDDKYIQFDAIFANYYVDSTQNRIENRNFNRFIIRADYSF
jgi:hypothetical protein